MKKAVKKFLQQIILLNYRLKCAVFYRLYGTEGIVHTITKLPKIYIIPILKIYGSVIGKGSDIDTGIILHNVTSKKKFKNLIIGENVHIGHNQLFDLSAKIEIGSNTAFGANCQIWTHTVDWTVDRKDEFDKINPVKIGKSVICYSNVIISQGIIIGDFSRVGAGSVVIRNIPNKVFYAGVPAKFIKERNI